MGQHFGAVPQGALPSPDVAQRDAGDQQAATELAGLGGAAAALSVTWDVLEADVERLDEESGRGDCGGYLEPCFDEECQLFGHRRLRMPGGEGGSR